MAVGTSGQSVRDDMYPRQSVHTVTVYCTVCSVGRDHSAVSRSHRKWVAGHARTSMWRRALLWRCEATAVLVEWYDGPFTQSLSYSLLPFQPSSRKYLEGHREKWIHVG